MKFTSKSYSLEHYALQHKSQKDTFVQDVYSVELGVFLPLPTRFIEYVLLEKEKSKIEEFVLKYNCFDDYEIVKVLKEVEHSITLI